MKQIPNHISSKADKSGEASEVFNKHTGHPVATMFFATEKLVEQAVQSVSLGFQEMKKLPVWQRKQILKQLVEKVKCRKQELIDTLVVEAGKTVTDATAEFERAIYTINLGVEEVSRVGGELLELGDQELTDHNLGITKRFPLGPALLVVPFNFPLNLMIHKVVPAIAAGCSFIIKPSEHTPTTASIISELLIEAGMPENGFACIQCDKKLVQKLTSDDRLKILSFTGSSKVGWFLNSKANKKKVLLELGGVGSCVVDETVTVNEDLINKIVKGAFSQAGQSCISLQRLFIHQSLFSDLKQKLVKRVCSISDKGDPYDSETFLSPVISNEAKSRIVSLLKHELTMGAKMLCGGEAKGNIISPAVLESVEETSKLCCEEVFAPILVIEPYEDVVEVFKKVNDSDYGLQVGIFTEKLAIMFDAFKELEVGGVIVNSVPTWRHDAMPYGGVKDSGQGREGIKSAIKEYTFLKTLVVNGV